MAEPERHARACALGVPARTSAPRGRWIAAFPGGRRGRTARSRRPLSRAGAGDLRTRSIRGPCNRSFSGRACVPCYAPRGMLMIMSAQGLGFAAVGAALQEIVHWYLVREKCSAAAYQKVM